jgi:peptidoglycan/xylan/chitin deacetylase (PgdA/CDA1 family)
MSNVIGAAGEPWQWDEPHWRGLVNQVRAGRRLAPARWKGGARCAVALSFDSDHDTNELRDGGKSIGRMSWGQYGNRVGVPRILDLLDRYGIKASFYVPAVAALLYPVVGFQPQHAAHRDRARPAIRLLADGGRGLL